MSVTEKGLSRRGFLRVSGGAALGAAVGAGCGRRAAPKRAQPEGPKPADVVSLFLCGDLMTGRGIDQVLPHPSKPRIYEEVMKNALGYVRLAEEASGVIPPRPVPFDYVWGAALAELKRAAPDVRIGNLETSVTTSEQRENKGMNYRMHPDNVPCLTAAGFDCCVLANNHVLDWGQPGLVETLTSLERAGLATAGAGRNLTEAQAPAALQVQGHGRVLVFAFASATAGVPAHWAATADRPGVSMLADFSDETVASVGTRVRAVKRPGDLAVASIHWGANWGWEVPGWQRVLAHALIDEADIDVVHGHSSHHPKGIEVYDGRPIFYGCGDFLNDYEGISGHELFPDDLAMMYFADMHARSGKLWRLRMTPMQIWRLRLNRLRRDEVEWVAKILDGKCHALDTRIVHTRDGRLALEW